MRVRAADGAEVGLVDALGTPAYALTRGPGGEAVEVEDEPTGDVRTFLWGPAEADFPVTALDGRPQGDAQRAGRETRSEPADEAGRRA